MRTEGREYSRYITKRSSLSLLLRKLFYKSVVSEFRGRLLDVGCGLGEFLQWYPNSVGIDTNPYLVRSCRRRGLKCSIGSAYKIPFKNGAFDCVLCSHVLEHLSKPESAVKEMHRVLRKGGKLVIIVPTERGFERDKTHVSFIDEAGIRKVLRNAGFSVKKISYYPMKSLINLTYLGELRVVATKN